MIIKIYLEEIPELNIETVSVIGTFNNYDMAKGILEKEGDMWFTYVTLEPGEYFYKFLINSEILLNDPNANIYLPHINDTLWSVIKISEEGRLYNNEQYTVYIDDYAVSGMLTEEKININKKNFNLLMDKQLVVRLGFRDITGLHAVTVLWYDSKGMFYDMAENMLYAEEENEKMVFLWYWLDLEEIKSEEGEGIWTMKLFIDGSYVLEDQFLLIRSITYSKNTLQKPIR